MHKLYRICTAICSLIAALRERERSPPFGPPLIEGNLPYSLINRISVQQVVGCPLVGCSVSTFYSLQPQHLLDLLRNSSLSFQIHSFPAFFSASRRPGFVEPIGLTQTTRLAEQDSPDQHGPSLWQHLSGVYQKQHTCLNLISGQNFFVFRHQMKEGRRDAYA